MKTNIAIIGALIVVLSSCSSPKYLPSSDKIDVNEYGSYIKISQKSASYIDGELIAIDSSEIVVLSEDTKKCVIVPVSEVKHFNLRYARPKYYGSSIPIYTVATITHGFWLILTAPVNLIVTISVTASGENAFTYNSKDMTYDKLKMFARFPQGIPPDIDLARIK